MVDSVSFQVTLVGIQTPSVLSQAGGYSPVAPLVQSAARAVKRQII
jgi:hypothetical protein